MLYNIDRDLSLIGRMGQTISQPGKSVCTAITNHSQ